MKVTVAYVHPNEISASFHACLTGLLMWDASNHGRLLHPHGQLALRCGTDGLVAARNQVAETFLASDVDWLLWIDSDMGFSPDSLDRLLDEADPTERPIIGGLCFASREYATDGMGGHRTIPRPTIYQWREHEGLMRFLGVQHYPVNAVVRCEATGSAFVLIHRDVLRRIHAEHGTWYTRLPGTDGNLLGEDISFCVRAGSLGIPIHVHTGVRTTHHKPQWVSEDDFWRTYPAPPATEQTAVIVPTVRAGNADRFMTSLRASTGLAHVYAVCDEHDIDCIEAWGQAGATVVSSPRRGYPAKLNVGFEATTEPWVLVAADDVAFGAGWLDHAQHVGDVENAAVVGTNDLGNPRVTRGEHATHQLIRRSYIVEHGASWDEPGRIAHEGYRHLFVDDEICTAAKQRGVWAFAMGSRVEHLHPCWGKAPDDAAYRKTRTNENRDRTLWTRRLKEHTA